MSPAKSEMTDRETVRAVLNRQPAERIPIDLGSTSVTGFHVTCVAALRDCFGLEKRPVKVHDPHQMLGWVDDDLRDALGVDVQGLLRRKNPFGVVNENWTPWSLPLESGGTLEVLMPEGFRTSADPSGDLLCYPEGDTSAPPSGRLPRGGFFFDVIIRQEPLDEERLNPEENLEEFGPLSDEDLQWLVAGVREASASGRAVMASIGGTAFGDIALVPAVFLKRPRGIRDITEWYVSLRSRRDYIHRVFSRQCEIALGRLEQARTVLGDAIDVVYVCGTDFGTQTSSFVSVETFRELWMPYYQRVNDWIHRNTRWKTFKHSCGSVERFVPSFIECGFDILNPVQCTAAHMEPEHLKRAYGEQIVFWGGGVDTQTVLPFGSPAEVREQVLRRCQVFSRGGGFVFAAIHNIQAGTPVENIIAMLDALREFNGRPAGSPRGGAAGGRRIAVNRQ